MIFDTDTIQTASRVVPCTNQDSVVIVYYPADADETNFQLHFPNKSVTNYVRYDLLRCAPSLTTFTVCLWLKTDDSADDGASFSYSLPGQDNEILLTDHTMLRFLIANTYR